MRPLLIPLVIIGSKYDQFQVKRHELPLQCLVLIASGFTTSPSGTGAGEEEDCLSCSEVLCSLLRRNFAVLQVGQLPSHFEANQPYLNSVFAPLPCSAKDSGLLKKTRDLLSHLAFGTDAPSGVSQVGLAKMSGSPFSCTKSYRLSRKSSTCGTFPTKWERNG